MRAQLRSKTGLILLTLLFASQAHAQAIITPIINYVTPLIFVILSGIVLAIGFQLFLSVLSIACGVSLMGNVETRRKNDARERSHGTGSVIRRVTTGMGLWSVITVSASLFVATVLSVRLSLLAGDGWIGIALGLVIWAAFFTLIVYIETKSVTSLVGGIASTAITGFRSGIEGMKSVFSPPAAAWATETQGATGLALSKLKNEIFQRDNAIDLHEKIERLVSRRKPPGLDYDRLRGGLADLLSQFYSEDFSSREKIDLEGLGFDRKTVAALACTDPRFSQQECYQIGRAFEDARWIAQSRRPLSNRAPSRGVSERIERYLRDTRRDELNPERIRVDFDRIFSEPSLERDLANSGLGNIDHGSLVAILEARRDLDHDRAENVANYAENAVSAVLNKISPRTATTDARIKENGREKLQSRLMDFVNNLDRPDFEDDFVAQEFEDILRDPEMTPEMLRQFIRNYDRNSLLKALETNENISRIDAERIATKIEQAREKALVTMDRIEKKLQEKTEEAKAKALHQAELVREATAASAWWLFATAACSGLAAIVGGILAVRP